MEKRQSPHLRTNFENTNERYMKKELKYFFVIVSIFTVSTFALVALLEKYSTLTFEHFIETCRQTATNFFSSGVHFVGFTLTVLTTLGALFLLTLSVLSFIKTKERLNNILKNEALLKKQKSSSLSGKLKFLWNKLIVVDYDRDLAITIGLRNPKIIISTCLIKKLSEKELEAVLLHEYYHLQNSHPLILIVSEILSSSMFFVPVIRELTKNLRTVVEREADKFVLSYQKTNRYLDLALEKVSNPGRFAVFPSFTRRNEYRVKKSSFVISTLVILSGIFLFLMPTQSHAIYDSNEYLSSNCGSNQCSGHCHMVQMMTPSFQYTSH